MNITLHKGTSFLISNDVGDIHRGGEHGLYFQDTRFLCHLELRLDGFASVPLSTKIAESNRGIYVMSNPELKFAARGTLGIVRTYELKDGTLHQEVEIENFGDREAIFSLDFYFGADFSHVFSVKQALESGVNSHREQCLKAELGSDRKSVFLKLGYPDIVRETHITFDRLPTTLSAECASFDLKMSRRGTFSLQMETSVVNESRTQETDKVKTLTTRNRPSSIVWESTEHKLGDARAILETDHPTLGDAYLQANTDLISLRTKSEDTHQNEYTIVAGIPWYMALFGRDSLIVSYQTMLHDPALARGTLHTLAKLQGADVDPISLEEPGKILHEYRRGEILSRRKLIPKFPYYGSIDATPLFLITLSEYVRCTGDLEFARALWPHVLNALQWIDQFGDADGDGFCEYFLKAESGPSNQGWKDSYDSIRFQDGRIARGSIALIEVQGYIVDAWTRMAELSSHLGNSQLARALIVRATKLKEKIVSAYWLKKRNYFALALDGEKTPVDSLTSNPGHLLWSGVLSQNHAKKLADKLLSDELFSGFGVRTMGTEEKGYNPLSYHNGSVWPHDNSLIVEGLVRYGFSGEATRITEGLLGALSHYSDPRLPELFSGYSSARFGIPIEYPSASRPQAWASGAIISLVRSLLGLRCNALTKQITLTPTPLPGMSFLKLKGVPLAGHFVDIEVSFRKNAGPKTVITGLAMSEWNTKTATQ